MPIQHLVLFDGNERNHLLPLTATRAVADIRVGILTVKGKWEKQLQTPADVLTQPWLQPKYHYQQQEDTIYVNAGILPTEAFISAIETLEQNAVIRNAGGTLLAAKISEPIDSADDLYAACTKINASVFSSSDALIVYPWDIFTRNGQEIRNDIRLLGLVPNGEILSKTNTILGNEIYAEDGVNCECSILNSATGPIYLAKDSEVMEGCTVRGAFALGEHSTLKMQAKIYGDTTIGPHCKIGGEVSNSVVFGFSNKGHDGFLGNSVIGEWCNLGADTNNSNLKNNYGTVSVWNYPAQDYISTGLQFCGLVMGDHAKSSINTMFNTGTVVGVAANVFSSGFPPKFIPDFSWGTDAAFDLEKAFEVAQRMMERRGIDLSETDKNMLRQVYDATRIFRK